MRAILCLILFHSGFFVCAISFLRYSNRFHNCYYSIQAHFISCVHDDITDFFLSPFFSSVLLLYVPFVTLLFKRRVPYKSYAFKCATMLQLCVCANAFDCVSSNKLTHSLARSFIQSLTLVFSHISTIKLNCFGCCCRCRRCSCCWNHFSNISSKKIASPKRFGSNQQNKNMKHLTNTLNSRLLLMLQQNQQHTYTFNQPHLFLQRSLAITFIFLLLFFFLLSFFFHL